VFARRGYNVQSLAVGNSEVEGQSRITMVIPGSIEGTSKIVKQLNKLVHVQQVRGHAHDPLLTPCMFRQCVWATGHDHGHLGLHGWAHQDHQAPQYACPWATGLQHEHVLTIAVPGLQNLVSIYLLQCMCGRSDTLI
jgi:hypothetical protein